MAEWIGHEGQLAPRLGRHRLLQLRARDNCPLHGVVDVVHHKVEMHRRPVAGVVARVPGCRGRGRTFTLDQQIKRGGPAEHLDASRAKTPPYCEPEGRAVEKGGSFKVAHVDINEKFHLVPPRGN